MEFVQGLLRAFVSEMGGVREALRKPRESPQTVEEEPERAESQPDDSGAQEGAQRRPWWRRILRG
jgi:hypothetical protein